nr:MAG TPA: hypothetical protein [Caudoviricetes sp.]
MRVSPWHCYLLRVVFDCCTGKSRVPTLKNVGTRLFLFSGCSHLTHTRDPVYSVCIEGQAVEHRTPKWR